MNDVLGSQKTNKYKKKKISNQTRGKIPHCFYPLKLGALTHPHRFYPMDSMPIPETTEF
jgi:hypothetical protein